MQSRLSANVRGRPSFGARWRRLIWRSLHRRCMDILVVEAQPVRSKPCFRFAQTTCPAGPFRCAHQTRSRHAPRSCHDKQSSAAQGKWRAPQGRPGRCARGHHRRARIALRIQRPAREGRTDAHDTSTVAARSGSDTPLSPPPVAAINREHYVALARLAANLNQLTRLANEGKKVTVADALLSSLAHETKLLRLALLGIGGTNDR
jgi:hypothetical protein